MKKSLFLLPALLLGTIPSLLRFSSSMPTIEAHAGGSDYKSASLTKEIDLNPVSDDDVRAYYSDLAGRSLSGEDLLKALKPILKNGQQYYNYDTNANIWKMYEITDRDWELSPAEEITNGTYDAAAGIIHNYSYGDNSDKKDNPYLHLLYRNPGVAEAKIRAWDHHGDNNGIDREHIWPKSRGFGKDPDNNNKESTASGARGDPHHLVAGDSYVNSKTHSNNSYGFVDYSKIADNAGANFKIDDATVVAGNYRGTSKTFGKSLGTADVFEPQDCDKGDIARACFYMVARYNNLAGDDDTIDGGNPNLFLEDTTDTTTIMSKADRPVSLGILRDLLAWHKLDPVDEYEKHRNDLIYRNYGKNRNPFIDFPTWVDAIWGTVELDNDNRTILSREVNPLGIANPDTDPLYEADNYNIVSYRIEPTVTEYFIGEDYKFEGKIYGVDESEVAHDITSRCAFDVSLEEAGEKNVAVSFKGEAVGNYAIQVVLPDSLEFVGPKKAFYVGDSYSFGGQVYAAKASGLRKEVTSKCTFAGYDMDTVGTQTVTVTHTPSSIQATYEIEVSDKPAPAPVDYKMLIIIGVAVLIALLIFGIMIGVLGHKRAIKEAKKAVRKVTKSRSSSTRKKTTTRKKSGK